MRGRGGESKRQKERVGEKREDSGNGMLRAFENSKATLSDLPPSTRPKPSPKHSDIQASGGHPQSSHLKSGDCRAAGSGARNPGMLDPGVCSVLFSVAPAALTPVFTYPSLWLIHCPLTQVSCLGAQT